MDRMEIFIVVRVFIAAGPLGYLICREYGKVSESARRMDLRK